MNNTSKWLVMALGLVALSLQAVTVTGVVDTRGAANARVVSGTVALGTPSGAAGTSWNSSGVADGWRSVTSEGSSTNLLVLNGCAVRGGRLAANATWDSAKKTVLRSSVFVPSGVTLTVALGAVVKFAPLASLVVESDGKLVLKGATLADLADDSVAGDTNCDGANSAPTQAADELVTGAGKPTILRVSLWNGGTREGLERWYTSGQPYGTLPALTKDGFRFDGWFTATEGGSQVTASTTVTATSLYAHWTAYAASLDKTEADVTASGGSVSLGITANTDWTVACAADWVTPSVTGGSGNGSVSLSVAPNGTTGARSATVVVTAAGMKLEFTVNQAGAEGVATPKITPADGTEFTGAARRCAISCETEGATIRYTLNGKDPETSDPAYGGKSFNVFDSTTIKARAFKDGMAPSAIAASRIVKKQTLADALDVPLWTVTNDPDAPWTTDSDETHGTKASVRTGAIDNEMETVMSTEVTGAGTLSFWWKASCEDDPDNDNWDYLSCRVDGSEVTRIDGETEWRQVSVKLGEGTHVIQWKYTKDDWDDTYYTGEDCGWIDAVSWTPGAGAGSSGITESWLQGVGAAIGAGDKSAAEIAASDPDGDGLTVEEEYIAGTDPTDPESKFTAKIEMVDGEPVVTWVPDLQGDEEPRSYKTYGSNDLENWEEVPQGRSGDYRFFKVSVEMRK